MANTDIVRKEDVVVPVLDLANLVYGFVLVV